MQYLDKSLNSACTSLISLAYDINSESGLQKYGMKLYFILFLTFKLTTMLLSALFSLCIMVLFDKALRSEIGIHKYPLPPYVSIVR